MSSISQDIETGIISSAAIGIMLSLEYLGLKDYISKSPLIFLAAFVLLMVFARRLSEKL